MPAKKKPNKNKESTAPNIEKRGSSSAIKREIWSIIIIAISILMLVSAIAPERVGFVGGLISVALYGLFGVGAFIIPVIVIICSIYSIVNKEGGVKTYQIVSISAILVLFFALMYLWAPTAEGNFSNFFTYLLYNFTEATVRSGGLFGALFGNFLLAILGPAGSHIAAISIMLALIVYLSGRSFFGGVRSAYKGVKSGIEDFVDTSAEDEYYDEHVEHIPNQEREEIKPRKKPKYRRMVDFVMAGGGKKADNERVLLFQDDFAKKAGAKSALDIEFDPDPRKKQESERSFDHEFYEDDTYDESEEFRINITGIVDDDYDEEILPSDDYDDSEINFKGDIDTSDDREIVDEKRKVELFDENKRYTKKELAELEKEAMVEQIAKEASTAHDKPKVHEFPPEELLKRGGKENKLASKAQILETSKKLEATLKSFGVDAKVMEVSKGPTVTRYELSPGQGVKVSKISGLADDLALNLAAQGIRIEAPIPGKAAVGIEIPNKEAQVVYFRDIVSDNEFKKFPSKLAFGLGKDIAGKTVVHDIARMPHLLIAGATGAGKSVCINTLVGSILYKASPEEVKLIMIDPKVVELSVYNGIPHLLIPVVTDPKKASGALNWAVREMLRRYELFAETGMRDLKGYNEFAAKSEERDKEPQIVIIIDELADLMMAAPGEVEDSICRLAQMARAAGLHLIIATQRPSVDVITGVIKANIPSRLAFSVSSGTDSRTILDMVGAEKLLGRGDMLFSPIGTSKPIRIQGAFISDTEVEAMVEFLKAGHEQEYSQEMIDNITSVGKEIEFGEDLDEYFDQAVEFVIQKEKASASMLQRQFRIGYNRAARLIEDLEVRGVIGPEDGSKPRKVLMTSYMWQEMKSGGDSNDEEFM